MTVVSLRALLLIPTGAAWADDVVKLSKRAAAAAPNQCFDDMCALLFFWVCGTRTAFDGGQARAHQPRAYRNDKIAASHVFLDDA